MISKGERLKTIREKANIRQVDLAQMLSVNRALVCQWEKNKKCPSNEMYSKISKLLNTNPLYLMGLTELTEPLIEVEIDGYQIMTSNNLDINKIKKILHLLDNEYDEKDLNEKINNIL